ncbi:MULTISPECIES: RNA polymerase sigma factor [unclassified Saccharothrix]|uniref:RNA polymerase sigma factor n=1 Tax=unclassified Saccharothrix TaxID=2593673 RepID=UPI00307F6022
MVENTVARDAWMVDVVRRCQRGEPTSWGEAIRLFRPLVARVARSFGLSNGHVEDVCQNTWIRMVQGIGTLREPEKARSWMVTVARREALRHLREHERHVPVGDGHEWDARPCPDPSPEDRALTGSERDQVRAAVAALSPVQRKLVALLFGDEECSYEEICARLGMPRGSIGPTRARIIKRVRQHLADLG